MQHDVDRGLLTNDSFLFEFLEFNGKKGILTGKLALEMLRAFVASIDYLSFGLTLSRIGLHSLRASAAMALFLNGVSPYVIMLLGRWSSDAFMLYLRKQVEEFNLNLSNLMITNSTFHYAPTEHQTGPQRSVSLQHHHGTRLNGEAIQSAFAVWPDHNVRLTQDPQVPVNFYHGLGLELRSRSIDSPLRNSTNAKGLGWCFGNT